MPSTLLINLFRVFKLSGIEWKVNFYLGVKVLLDGIAAFDRRTDSRRVKQDELCDRSKREKRRRINMIVIVYVRLVLFCKLLKLTRKNSVW